MRGNFDKEIKAAISQKNRVDKANKKQKFPAKAPKPMKPNMRKPPFAEEVAEGEMPMSVSRFGKVK